MEPWIAAGERRRIERPTPGGTITLWGAAGATGERLVKVVGPPLAA